MRNPFLKSIQKRQRARKSPFCCLSVYGDGTKDTPGKHPATVVSPTHVFTGYLSPVTSRKWKVHNTLGTSWCCQTISDSFTRALPRQDSLDLQEQLPTSCAGSQDSAPSPLSPSSTHNWSPSVGRPPVCKGTPNNITGEGGEPEKSLDAGSWQV